MITTAVKNEELKLESEGIRKLASIYHAIDHPTRLAIMKLIHAHESMSVMEISDKMQLDKETISQHLGILRRGELVHSIPRSRFRYYSLNYKILNRLCYRFDP
ncbi:MAG TPA: metalloregulator ArsR/SmtB family transcription factor [Flavisolibacter sp.]|jgi:DNA-binding transcriptional ArsR family regulator|nr:metalloregulator ArsR/SmtB family transcription factor [Flavisolibacter sp.]